MQQVPMVPACLLPVMRLPTMMGWSEPAPPPVVSWYDSVVDSVVELWS